MLQIWNADISKVIVHKVGNKAQEDGVSLSKELLEVTPGDDLHRILGNFFLKPLENALQYNFIHPVTLSLNEVYTICREIFEHTETFVEKSQQLCKLLYEYSTHPNIKAGELYVAYFSNCIYDGKKVDAIGLFKSESKDTFLRLVSGTTKYDVNYFEDGVNIDKLDKGCIVVNTQQEEGYIVQVFDSANKKTEANYWKDQFLQILAANDEYHNTHDYLNATKNFITKQIPQEYEVNKADQADFLNRSLEFFKKNTKFDEGAFTQEVFGDKELIQSFNNYKQEYQNDNAIELNTDFSISEHAVKKSARVFKSVLKLDKNFHVYIHGDRDLIEKGYDEAVGKSYYKIYFDTEN